MELKMVEVDGQQLAVVQDGKPVYVDGDGKEIAFDVVGTGNTIKRLNGESKGHREKYEATRAELEGIRAEYEKASGLLSNIENKKLIDAGEVEKVKAEMAKGFQAMLDEANGKAAQFEQRLYGEMIGGSFARSTYIEKNLAIPPDLVQSHFGSAFKIEDGQIVAYDRNGNKLHSKTRMGEPANFEEAIEMLVDEYPRKSSILAASGATGSGSGSGKAGGAGGQNTVSRAQFAQMGDKSRAAFVKAGGKVVD